MVKLTITIKETRINLTNIIEIEKRNRVIGDWRQYMAAMIYTIMIVIVIVTWYILTTLHSLLLTLNTTYFYVATVQFHHSPFTNCNCRL